jgi:hypothetical protein
MILLYAERRLTTKEVAEIVRESQATVLRWLKRYMAEGLEGLKDAPRPGRDRTVTDTYREKLIEAVRRRPRSPDLDFSLLQANQRLCQALIVACQAAEARHAERGEAALDYPTSGQQHKATLGRRQFRNLQPDALALSVACGLLAGVAQVYEGDFDRVAGRLLDLCGQRADLRPVLAPIFDMRKAGCLRLSE